VTQGIERPHAHFSTLPRKPPERPLLETNTARTFPEGSAASFVGSARFFRGEKPGDFWFHGVHCSISFQTVGAGSTLAR